MHCRQHAYRHGSTPRSWKDFLAGPAEYSAPQCPRPLSAEDTLLCAHAGLSAKLLRELRALACRYGLQRLILFGSRARRGDYWRASDIDLAAEGGNIDCFASDADALTCTPLKYDVLDLSLLNSPELLRDIGAQGVVLYEKV